MKLADANLPDDPFFPVRTPPWDRVAARQHIESSDRRVNSHSFAGERRPEPGPSQRRAAPRPARDERRNVP